jgi:hypothetical protein
MNEGCYKRGDLKIYEVHLIFVGLLSGVVAVLIACGTDLFRVVPAVPGLTSVPGTSS